jgi:ABC-type antimicrobial peptide transport system permease subunit
MVLGARASEVRGMFLRRAAFLSAFGIVVGLAAAFGLTCLMGSLLFNVIPADPLTYGLVSGVLVLIAPLAS